MRISLEQVYYGRGKFGYGILGASSGGKAFGDAVQALCETIGSPDAFSSWKPFLVNKRFGDYCLMCSVQLGEPDSCGRATVFYHVLIGLASEMVAAGIDAFVLSDKGLFRNNADGHPEALSVEGRPKEAPPARPFCCAYPAVISVSEPAPDLVRNLLGDESTQRSWSTFAFHSMAGFDLCALDARVAPIGGAIHYDSQGKVLSSVATTTGSNVRQTTPAKKSAVLCISLAANVILIILSSVLLIARNSEPRPVPAQAVGNAKAVAEGPSNQLLEKLKTDNDRLSATNVELTADVARLREEVQRKGDVAVGLVSREDVVKELQESFSLQYHGRRQGELPKSGYSPMDRDKYNPYVRFVNEKILTFSAEK